MGNSETQKKVNDESVVFQKQLPEPKFAVDLQVFFEFPLKNKSVRATANILGWQKPKYLITSFPLAENRVVRTSPDTEIIVRYLLDGTIYGFTTRMIHKQSDPFPMWVLNYPTFVQMKTLRRSPRIQVTLPVEIDNGESCHTIDISAHGALLSIAGKISMGDKIVINFTLPNGEQINHLGADVVRIQASRDETLAGVNFDAENKMEINKISNYLYSTEEPDGKF